MMNKPLLLLLCILLSACIRNNRQPVIEPAKSITDSVDKTYGINDSLSLQSAKPSPAQILKQCLNNYKVVTTVDTLMPTDSGLLHIQLKHYCAYDDGIILPEKYSGLIGLKTFATHNFITDITISRNMRPIYAGRVSKDDFLPLLSGDLKLYGSMLLMSGRLQRSRSGKGFVINYSLSIPLTNVNQQITVDIEPNGSRQMFVDYGLKAEKAWPDTAKLAAVPKDVY